MMNFSPSNEGHVVPWNVREEATGKLLGFVNAKDEQEAKKKGMTEYTRHDLTVERKK